MTPKADFLNSGDILLLSILDNQWFIHCNEHNNVPMQVYDCSIINRSLICSCQLQGGNEFLHESLASCPSSDKVDRNMYFTINMVFATQLQMNFLETATKNFTGQLRNHESSFPIAIIDFSNPTSNLETSHKTKIIKRTNTTNETLSSLSSTKRTWIQ